MDGVDDAEWRRTADGLCTTGPIRWTWQPVSGTAPGRRWTIGSASARTVATGGQLSTRAGGGRRPDRAPTDRSCPHRGTLFHRIGAVIHSQGGRTVSRRTSRRGRRARHAEGGSVRVDELADRGDLAPQLVVDGRLAVDLVAGMEDRRVVATAELGADPEERHVGLLAHQEHRDLAGHDDRLVALLALERLHRDAVVVGDHLGDPLRSHLALLRVVDDVGQDSLGELDADRHRAHAGVGDDPVERALELADVADDLAGDELDHVGRDRDRALFRLGPQDRDPRLEVGRREIGDQAPFEPAAQSLLEGDDLLRRPVARQDDLLAVLVDRVERVEELLLRPLLVGDELDVVDEEEVDPSIACPELVDLALLDRGDELVGELLGGRVDDLLARELGDHLVADRVHQVGLAEADPAVQEQRVVGVAGALGDRQAGGMGQAVGRADDEVGEGVAGVEVRRPALAADPGRLEPDLLGVRGRARADRRARSVDRSGRPRAAPTGRRTRPGRCSRRSGPGSARSATDSGCRASPWRSHSGRRSGTGCRRRRRAACRAATSRSWPATGRPGARRGLHARLASRPSMGSDLWLPGAAMGNG